MIKTRNDFCAFMCNPMVIYIKFEIYELMKWDKINFTKHEHIVSFNIIETESTDWQQITKLMRMSKIYIEMELYDCF